MFKRAFARARKSSIRNQAAASAVAPEPLERVLLATTYSVDAPTDTSENAA